MRKPPSAKVALSMACPGCSAPPASTTPVMMMVPGPDGAVDATWKYSVRADRAGVHDSGADSAHPGPGDQGPALIGSAGAVALAVVVCAEDVPAAAAIVAPRMAAATAAARTGRDGMYCRRGLSLGAIFISCSWLSARPRRVRHGWDHDGPDRQVHDDESDGGCGGRRGGQRQGQRRSQRGQRH